LDAAVNPNTVVVPCYPTQEVQASEILVTESQTNLNSGKKEGHIQSTWLPTHNAIGGSESAVKGFKFLTGFSGSGQTLCNSESGTPIYRDREDGTREFMGVNMKSRNVGACSESLSFASVTRHGAWIAEQCAQFADADSNFEQRPKSDAVCEQDKLIELSDCTESQEISSPGYPALYENDITCSWNLRAPKGHQIVMSFVDVDIERSNHKRKCNHDALVWTVPMKMPMEICSSQPVRPRYVSPKETASLEFRTDSSLTGRGFKARVSCQKKPTMANKNPYFGRG